MKPVRDLIELLNPFKELLTIVVFLIGAGYAAITYFATADQLAQAQIALEQKLDEQLIANKAAMEEIKCLNSHNRGLLQVQIEEVGLRAILEKNVQQTEHFKQMKTSAARVELANLDATRISHIERMTILSNKRTEIISALQNGSCSPQT